SDARARQDVVEMIEQQVLPGFGHDVLRIRTSIQRRPRRELLRVQHILLRPPDSALGLSLGGKHSAMILEIKFPIPGGHLDRRQLLLHIAEEIARRTELQFRKYKTRRAYFLGMIEHDARRAATMIAHAVQVHHLGLVWNFRSVNRWHPGRDLAS